MRPKPSELRYRPVDTTHGAPVIDCQGGYITSPRCPHRAVWCREYSAPTQAGISFTYLCKTHGQDSFEREDVR